MGNVSPWQLFMAIMTFTLCGSIVLSATILKKYPYWNDYLTDPHVLHFKHYLTNPIDVLPGRLFENYTRLTVSK